MKRLLLLIFSAVLLFNAEATHIVGGEIMYEFQSENTFNKIYKIKLFLYIDCINGSDGAIASDIDGLINVFNAKNEVLLTNLCKTVRRNSPTRVSDVNYSCIKTTPNACVDKYVYETTISLPKNGNFIISFERCCRNNTISNIVAPESTGATYWTEINTSIDNSSPSFKNLPPNFLCTNAPLNFDHSAYDADGDSLVYELFQPYDGAGTSTANSSRPDYSNFNNLPHYPKKLILWQSSYNTYFNQIDGIPTLTIDEKNGKLTLTPTKTGQYVIGLKVKEYRNGVLIGETKRDFQFNVSECVFYVVSSFFAPKYNCNNNEVSFTNRSQGGITYHWDFGDPFSQQDTSIFTNPKYKYSIPGNYTVRLITRSNTCNDTSEYDIVIKESFQVHLPEDTLICGKFTIPIRSDLNDKLFKWNTGETTPEITVNKGGSYWIEATDAPCSARDTMVITNDLSFLDLGPDSVICRDSFVQFTYLGAPGYNSYLWNDNTDKQTVFISQLGKYWVNVTNENNCPSSDSITFILYPPPHIYINDSLFCKNTPVTLDGVNYSSKTNLETTYSWNSGQKTPQITTYQPGQYIVTVRNKLCTIIDTANLQHIETGLDLGNDTFYCGPVDRWIIPQDGFVKYIWEEFSEDKNIHATSPGKYKLTIVSKEGCVESDSITLYQYPQIDGGLGDDTTICISSKLQLTASDSMVDYLWNTGATSRSISVSEAGVYTITVRNENGCVISDSVSIFEQADALPIDLFMPNAFSPNDDFINETFPGNNYSDPGSPYLLSLYNRWGEKIFESESPNFEWDGKIKGNYAPQDVYVYQVRYVACDNVERYFRGTFTLIR
ncbi:MAG: gliding motility-associated C-terminal domain-containing protein [Bacteroidia bacterium]